MFETTLTIASGWLLVSLATATAWAAAARIGGGEVSAETGGPTSDR